MAAPSNTVWSEMYGEGGRLGIYTEQTISDTQVSVKVQIWVWTRYACTDSGNYLYLDVGPNVTAATTQIGSVNIAHTVNSSWSTANQTMVYENEIPYTYDRTLTTQTINIYAKLTGINWVGVYMYGKTSFTIPSLPAYAVVYLAPNASNIPSGQTKYHDVTLTLSSQVPYLMGARFVKWLSSYNGQYYDPGDFYGHNASTNMLAQWEAITYTVTYNANGGTGAPEAQDKYYGVELTLSNTEPTRENYKFLGWAASSTATTATYAAGGSYTNNAAVTLYAVWELAYTPPTISGVSIYRCTEDGTADDYGTYAKVLCAWSVDTKQSGNTAQNAQIYYKLATAEYDSTPAVLLSVTGTSGSINQIIGKGELSVDNAYNIKIVVQDTVDKSDVERTIGAVKFPIDFLAGGNGVSFGKPATKENAAEFDFDIWANKELYDKYGLQIKNGLAAYTGSGDAAIDPDTTLEHLCLTNKNTPMGTEIFMFVLTLFYSVKTETAARSQIALPYNQLGSMYHRYYTNGAWSEWRRHTNADEGVVTKDMFVYSDGTLNITM